MANAINLQEGVECQQIPQISDLSRVALGGAARAQAWPQGAAHQGTLRNCGRQTGPESRQRCTSVGGAKEEEWGGGEKPQPSAQFYLSEEINPSQTLLQEESDIRCGTDEPTHTHTQRHTNAATATPTAV